MNRPLIVAALSTLAIAACGQKQEATPSALPAPAAVVAPAPVTPAVAETPVAAATDGIKPVDVSSLPGEPKLQQK
jgi:hypothetical protein